MTDFTGWRQPVPIDILERFGDDHAARRVYLELLLLAAYNDKSPTKRGTYAIGLRRLGERVGLSKDGVSKAVERLSKNGRREVDANKTLGRHLISVDTSGQYGLYKIENYDEIVGMKRPVDANKTQGRRGVDNLSESESESDNLSKDKCEDSPKVTVESKKETITQATYQNNSEQPLQNSAKVSPPKPHGDPGVNRVMALLTNFCTEKLGRGTFSDPQQKQRFNASNIMKLGHSDEEMIRRLTVILEGGNNFKISKMKSVYGMWDLIKNFDKSDEAEAQKQKELAKWKEQKKAETGKPSTLARWNQESTTMKSPVMQKIEANTLPVAQAKPVADTPEKKRVADLYKMFEALGVKRGIPMKFGVAACDIVKINASDEEILRAGEHMLDLEIRKHQDMPASERVPLKEFPIRFIALSRELGRASHDLVVG